MIYAYAENNPDVTLKPENDAKCSSRIKDEYGFWLPGEKRPSKMDLSAIIKLCESMKDSMYEKTTFSRIVCIL